MHLVGASAGAAVAVELVARLGRRVESLTALGGAFLPAPADNDPLLARLTSSGLDRTLRRLAVDASVPPGTRRAVRRAVFEDVCENTAETAAAIWHAALATDVRDLIPRGTIGCTVVTGEYDAICPPGQARWFADAVGGRLVVLGEVGHLPFYEVPERVVSLIRETIGVPA